MDIASVLLRHQVVTRDQLDAFMPSMNGHRLDVALVERGLANEEAVLKAFADELGMKFVDIKREDVDKDLLMQFPTTAVFRHSLLPIQRQNGSVVVATSDPFNLEALEELDAPSAASISNRCSPAGSTSSR